MHIYWYQIHCFKIRENAKVPNILSNWWKLFKEHPLLEVNSEWTLPSILLGWLKPSVGVQGFKDTLPPEASTPPHTLVVRMYTSGIKG